MAQFYCQSKKYALVLACCLALSGCKEVLFSELNEIEANEMVALLAASGVDASRERDKDNVYQLLISAKDVAVATTLLRAEGYPKPKFQSLGDVFSAEGIVGTPFEQHARYVHAMNEELSRTITSISGIRSARVLVTAPPKERYAREEPVATASVMINYDPGFDIEDKISRIKTIIAHSLPNLDYDNVAVAFFPAAGPQITAKEAIAKPPAVREASILSNSGGSSESSGGFGFYLGVLGSFSLAVALWLGFVRFGLRAGEHKADGGSE